MDGCIKAHGNPRWDSQDRTRAIRIRPPECTRNANTVYLATDIGRTSCLSLTLKTLSMQYASTAVLNRSQRFMDVVTEEKRMQRTG